jgi:hypothetical protein
MIRPTLAVAIAATLFSFGPVTAEGGPIRNACLRTDKGNQRICACIQQAADMTLRRADQRRAAKFFTDPDKAQDVFLSKRAADDAFWDRYRQFGSTAEAQCR